MKLCMKIKSLHFEKSDSWTTKKLGLRLSALIVKTVCSWGTRAAFSVNMVCLWKSMTEWLTAKRKKCYVIFFFYMRQWGWQHFDMKGWRCDQKHCTVASVCHCPLLSVCCPLLYIGGKATFTARDAVEQSLSKRLNRPPVSLCLNENSHNSNNLCQFQNK